jgi:3'-phosphoadenosine 5'-phosphosulfate sulfotransferase (PAPS reductase)/FAD synthetase
MNENQVYRKVSSYQYQTAINDAHKIVKEAVKQSKGNIALGLSAGKDSVCMLDIVAQYCKPLIIWNDSGLEMPENESIVKQCAERYDLKYVIAKGDILSYRKQENWNKDKKCNDAEDELTIYGPIKETLKEYNIDLEFIGLRIEESKRRKMLILKYGPIHQSIKWNCSVAWPMRYWKAADCHAYIDEHKLILHPLYLKTKWQERDKIRVSWSWPICFENRGALTLLKFEYPELFRKLREEFDCLVH